MHYGRRRHALCYANAHDYSVNSENAVYDVASRFCCEVFFVNGLEQKIVHVYLKESSSALVHGVMALWPVFHDSLKSG